MTTAEKLKTVKFGEAKGIVRHMLMTNNEWLVRGLVALHNRQTEDEKRTQDVKYLNKMGFNSADAAILSSFAEQWKRKTWLSDKQMVKLRGLMLKYAGQLARISRGEAVAVAD
jgi:hypothetical protein